MASDAAAGPAGVLKPTSPCSPSTSSWLPKDSLLPFALMTSLDRRPCSLHLMPVEWMICSKPPHPTVSAHPQAHHLRQAHLGANVPVCHSRCWKPEILLCTHVCSSDSGFATATCYYLSASTHTGIRSGKRITQLTCTQPAP